MLHNLESSLKDLLSIFPFLTKQTPEKGEKGDRGEKGEKGDKGDKGEKGESVSTTEKLYPYIVPEIDGVEEVMSFYYRSPKGFSPDYASYTHYSNKVFDRYDFVARDQFPTAYEHIKLAVLDEERKSILFIPEREVYSDIFKDFRLVPGSASTGVDISLSLVVMNKIIESQTCLQNKPINFILYFYPDKSCNINTMYSRSEIISDKVVRLEKEVRQLKKDIDMKFEIMKNDLGMRMSATSRSKKE